MSVLRQIAATLAALILCVWRLTCRYRVINDPRPGLRAQGKPYVYALLHAHQLAAVFLNDDRIMAAMVSRSADGELLIPALRMRRVRAVRGSSRKGNKDKGGRAALAELTRLLGEGIPALLAVDGPRGPRNHVHRGVAELAKDSRAAILPCVVLPARRLFLSRTWDRMQIPQPFTTIRLVFGEPLVAGEAEMVEALRARVGEALDALERTHDPSEHERVLAARQAAAVSTRSDLKDEFGAATTCR